MPTLVAVDSSALVKLLLVEDGSELARLVWQRADAVIATRLARVESAAALTAARRAGRLRRAGETRAHAELESLWVEVAVRELTHRLELVATRLARLHTISGADAIHLAAATDARGVLLTWDRRLGGAATMEGLAVLPQG